MSWLETASRFRGSPTVDSVREYMPEANSGDPTSIYQSRDFPQVFLGGASMQDLQAASEMAGIGPEDFLRFNVAAQDTEELDRYMPVASYSVKLPEAGPETNELMDEDMYGRAQKEFNAAADELAQTITSTKRPIYVHCAVGMNRSVAVLAAALTKLTQRSVTDILREMKEQRFMVAPHDAYFMMAVEYSKNESDVWKHEIRQRLDVDREKTEPIKDKTPVFENRWSICFEGQP